MARTVRTADSNEVEGSDLQMIVALVKKQQVVASEVAAMEERLEELKLEHKRLSEELIPDKFMELGIQSLALSDGSEVQVEKYYAAHISKDRAPEAMRWLRKHHFDDIIKSEVIVVCKRGEQGRMKQASAALKAVGVPHELRDTVHHATLKAFAREQIESGNELPVDLFGIFIGNKTKIILPK